MRQRAHGVSLSVLVLELLPAALACGLFAAVGVMHVSARAMAVRVGYELSRLEHEGQTLEREHDRLKLELATLKNPMRLEKLAREKLSMGPPQASAVLEAKATR